MESPRPLRECLVGGLLPRHGGSAMSAPGPGADHWPAGRSRPPDAVLGQPIRGRAERWPELASHWLRFLAAQPRRCYFKGIQVEQRPPLLREEGRWAGGGAGGGGGPWPLLAGAPCHTRFRGPTAQQRQGGRCHQDVAGGRGEEKAALSGGSGGVRSAHTPCLMAPEWSCPLAGVWGRRQKSQLLNKWLGSYWKIQSSRKAVNFTEQNLAYVFLWKMGSLTLAQPPPPQKGSWAWLR